MGFEDRVRLDGLHVDSREGWIEQPLLGQEILSPYAFPRQNRSKHCNGKSARDDAHFDVAAPFLNCQEAHLQPFFAHSLTATLNGVPKGCGSRVIIFGSLA